MEKQITYKGIKLELVYYDCSEKACEICFFYNIDKHSCADNCKNGTQFDCQNTYIFRKVSEIRKEKMKKIFK